MIKFIAIKEVKADGIACIKLTCTVCGCSYLEDKRLIEILRGAKP